ncbi:MULTISPECIES: DUF1428 domain-containing protein [unclassified Oceanobacter]|jgi:uncharacterized protein YbaA (DUF1428 family)|uniref:DUF1428 domain-containing protein n=1 Tax=unclassified Oceanobacter TaxID=2620260 RepID=UPI0026E3CE76|nr:MULTISPECIES: DUF1428 domain-containing protein [unclassified Oceanobacter]MDO6683033.1 DUF1428 domain-containing protein [Oceanobacter sp. 5_MG-2023]MDP2548157.1 DUF1428 domain-containing protein [Oceanobacter sp. 4_MG-2023]MDP2609566.1 DUF1428 domain-containing protein [Oceanobacter sp. 1_MG-2023]MDP2612973.1 DUF1428 domain-containing protein [Oceanobacter sp. 2_MG-2023]
MSYIDGFVAAVPTENKEKYIAHAEFSAVIFKDHGALSIREAWGDELPDGEVTSFPMAVKCKENETVVFSTVVWPSKEVRDAGWAAIMADPRMNPENNPMPFDGKRLIHGGFDVLIEG